MRGFSARNKYGNKKIETPDGRFDSKLELRQYEMLMWRQRAGEILGLQRQVRIKLGNSPQCKVSYIADFAYFDNKRGVLVLHDSKGVETPEFVLKRKWLLDCYSGFVFLVAYFQKTIEFKPFSDDNTLLSDYLEAQSAKVLKCKGKM